MGHFNGLISTAELATAVNVKIRWIQKLADELIKKGYAKRIGKTLVCHESAIDYIKSRPGAKKQD